MSKSDKEFNGPKYFAKFLLLFFAVYFFMFYLWYIDGGHRRETKDKMFIGPNSNIDGWEFSNEIKSP